MKRLFRTSKPIVDPLPPPSAPTEYAPQQPPTAGAGVKAGHRLEGHGQPHGESGGGSGKNWFGGSAAPSVTPFPVDAGHGGGGGGPMRRISRREKKDRGSAPSMLEMQQQQQQQNRLSAPPLQIPNKHDSLPYPPNPPSKQTQSRFYEQPSELSSPDSAWTVVPPTQQQQRYAQSSPEPYGSRNGTPPLPIPAAPGMYSGGSGRSSPSSAQLYLPPGARPPTPPAALRPATPNHHPRSPMGQSHSSLHSVSHLEEAAARSGRDRGYSSASNSVRGSDIESSIGHSAPGPKAAKIIPTQPVRSPLANPYAPVSQSSFPTLQPHPFQLPPGQGPSPYSPLEEEQRQLGLPPPPAQQQPVYADVPAPAGKDKEKKKFWGMDMNWSKKDKDKEGKKDKDTLGVQEQQGGRKSFDWSRAQDHSVPQTGYAVTAPPNGQAGALGMNMGSPMVMEDEQRGRMAGRMFFRDHENKDPSSAKDVSAAIQLLCANPDPSFSAVYVVCDRINHSDQSETVCKDAARAIRKQFKHGNEGERRAAAVVWLLMMRNVPVVRPHAASKKVLACLEPILLASPQKPVVNANTYRTISDILADLAYSFGGEKGCEPLVDLWKKVKMPQEPDNGRPLPDDHQIFTPEAQFPTHMLDRNNAQQNDGQYQPNGDHGVYPSHQDDRPPGPGYANLPSHGEDMRRLIEECTAGKEAARVLSEALVYSRPEELEQRPIVREFYNKCFHAHESLTNQMDWAQAEARSSRERSQNTSLSLDPASRPQSLAITLEEQALAALFDAHAALSEVIRQHDELDRMAMEQREMSEARERSKKETKMGRDDPSRYEQQPIQGSLSASQGAHASSSRSPSPAGRLNASPRAHHLPLPPQFASGPERSRTPSPDYLPPPPRLSSSPHRPPSPLGARPPRPLPNPFKSTGSSASLKSSSAGHSAWVPPANLEPGRQAGKDADGEDEEDVPAVPLKPSRKALGKRPAKPVDPDNHFDPNDMFAGKKEDSSKSSSEESVTVDDVFFHKPVEYAYDAYQEKVDREASDAAGARARQGGGSSARYVLPERQGGGSGGSGAGGYGQGAPRVDARA